MAAAAMFKLRQEVILQRKTLEVFLLLSLVLSLSPLLPSYLTPPPSFCLSTTVSCCTVVQLLIISELSQIMQTHFKWRRLLSPSGKMEACTWTKGKHQDLRHDDRKHDDQDLRHDDCILKKGQPIAPVKPRLRSGQTPSKKSDKSDAEDVGGGN